MDCRTPDRIIILLKWIAALRTELRRFDPVFYIGAAKRSAVVFIRMIFIIKMLFPVAVIKDVTAFGAELRRILRVLRLPAALVTAV